MSAQLRIAKNGTIQLNGDVDAAHCARSYVLLETPSGLLVGVEEGGEAPGGHAVILAGDLAQIAFSEVVSVIAHGRSSGALRVYGASATRTVLFGSGEVRGAFSSRVGERLDEIAVHMGLVQRDAMERLMDEAGDPRRAARLAVERGLLSERALSQAVQEHVTAIFQAILLEPRGTFVLTDERIDERLAVPGLSAEAILMEGARRLDELRLLRSSSRASRARRLQRRLPRHLR